MLAVARDVKHRSLQRNFAGRIKQREFAHKQRRANAHFKEENVR
jgi:hypothetical protein